MWVRVAGFGVLGRGIKGSLRIGSGFHPDLPFYESCLGSVVTGLRVISIWVVEFRISGVGAFGGIGDVLGSGFEVQGYLLGLQLRLRISNLRFKLSDRF